MAPLWAITMEASDSGFQAQGTLLQPKLCPQTVADHGFARVADGGILRIVSSSDVLSSILGANSSQRPNSSSRLGGN